MNMQLVTISAMWFSKNLVAEVQRVFRKNNVTQLWNHPLLFLQLPHSLSIFHSGTGEEPNVPTACNLTGYSPGVIPKAFPSCRDKTRILLKNKICLLHEAHADSK